MSDSTNATDQNVTAKDLKDMLDTIYELKADEAPLAKFLTNPKTYIQSQAKAAMHQWFEDELVRCPDILAVTCEDKRICPHFIHCGIQGCEYARPERTKVAVLKCHAIKELPEDSDSVIVLEEVD